MSKPKVTLRYFRKTVFGHWAIGGVLLDPNNPLSKHQFVVRIARESFPG